MKKIATAVALTLVLSPLSGCWGGDEPAGKTQRPTSKSSETPKPTPPPQPQPVAIKGVPQGLVTAIEKFYNKKDLGTALDPKIAPQVAERQHPTAPIKGVGSTGTWKGRPIAVVTSGQDVTLAVEDKGWVIVGGWWPSLGVAKPALGGARRVLAIGGDAREDGGINAAHAIAAGTEVARSRADSLHIIGFDGEGGAGMLGLARDFYAQLATGGPKQKINGAMPIGGPEAQLATVSSFTGVPLEGYVLVGFNGFMKLIDLFGPLSIYLAKPIKICDGCNMIPGGGEVELNSKLTLHLARARKFVRDGDFGRSRNQGRILLAAAAMAKAQGPRQLPHFMTMASPILQTNLSPRQILTFLAHIYTLRPKRVPNKVAKGPSTTVDGRYVVMPDEEARTLFSDMADGNLQPLLDWRRPMKRDRTRTTCCTHLE